MQHLYDIDVRVPMRDGVALAANVWRPAQGEAPTLLVRLPYSKDAKMTPKPNVLVSLPARPITVVVTGKK